MEQVYGVKDLRLSSENVDASKIPNETLYLLHERENDQTKPLVVAKSIYNLGTLEKRVSGQVGLTSSA